MTTQNEERNKMDAKVQGRMARMANPNPLPSLVQKTEERTRLRKVNAELRRRKRHEHRQYVARRCLRLRR